MSARHIQKPKQINFKDGTLGTALLVTLAFDAPPVGVLQSESYIPTDRYTGPPPGPDSLPNSAKMLLPDYVPSKSQQEWTSLMMNCLLQLAQASLVEKDGFPWKMKTLGELYLPSEFSKEDTDSRCLIYGRWAGTVEYKVKGLLEVLDPKLQAQWKDYEIKHGLVKMPEEYKTRQKSFHAAQWIFANAPPEFFTKNSEKIREFTFFLKDWCIKFFEETSRVPDQIPDRLHDIPDAIINWKPERLGRFKQVDQYLIKYHTLKYSYLKP